MMAANAPQYCTDNVRQYIVSVSIYNLQPSGDGRVVCIINSMVSIVHDGTIGCEVAGTIVVCVWLFADKQGTPHLPSP